MTTRHALHQEQIGRAGSADSGPGSSVPPSFEIVVLFTTIRETLAALHAAGRLAQGVATGIRLLVPQVVPYPLPLDEPPVPSGLLIREFQLVLEDCQLATWIDVCRCRDRWQAIRNALSRPSVLVIGGAPGWWPSRKYRIVARLRAAGHQVLFSCPE